MRQKAEVPNGTCKATTGRYNWRCRKPTKRKKKKEENNNREILKKKEGIRREGKKRGKNMKGGWRKERGKGKW